jgi:hypothetical protein
MRKLVGHGHKLYKDNFFSLSDLFDSLTKKKYQWMLLQDFLAGNNKLK